MMLVCYIHTSTHTDYVQEKSGKCDYNYIDKDNDKLLSWRNFNGMARAICEEI